MNPTAAYPLFRGEGLIEFVEKPIPEAGPGQLLVQCKANALCVSDLGGFRRGSDVTMGHEIAGVVVQAGDGTATPVGTPGVDFCAIVGRTPERTRTRAAEFGVRYYLDINEMLDCEQPDLVSLSLPNQGHFDATMAVIEAGYPLLVEKPLVFDLAEADQLLDAAAKRDLFFAINFNHRYARPVEPADEAIQAGRLGDLA